MPKHILYCADGTWNGPGDPKNTADIDATVNLEAALEKTTNVVKLFRNLAGAVTSETQPFPNEWEKALPGASGAPLQVAKYMHGVGDSSNLVMKALGGALGVGVIARVVRGYTYISRQYRYGDSVHIVGFSRGAYTARALAGMIGAVGLLNPAKYDVTDKERAYDLGYAAWLKARGVVFGGGGSLARFFTGLIHQAEMLASRLVLSRDAFIPKVPIQSVAVWDTVGSMGIPLYIQDKRRDAFSFVDAKLNPLVSHGFHAMALDERRRDFPITRWVAREGVEEVWFAGCHSDVGGGYPPNECGLSDLALEWMMGKLSTLGVRLSSPLTYAPELTHYSQDFHKPWETPPFNIEPQPRVPLKDDAYSKLLVARWSACTPYQACWPNGFEGCRLV